MMLWDCNYCETINGGDAMSCIACEAVKTVLIDRPVLRHPLLQPRPAESKSPNKASRGAGSVPSSPRLPVPESPHFEALIPKKSFWKKVFGE